MFRFYNLFCKISYIEILRCWRIAHITYSDVRVWKIARPKIFKVEQVSKEVAHQNIDRWRRENSIRERMPKINSRQVERIVVGRGAKTRYGEDVVSELTRGSVRVSRSNKEFEEIRWRIVVQNIKRCYPKKIQSSGSNGQPAKHPAISWDVDITPKVKN